MKRLILIWALIASVFCGEFARAHNMDGPVLQWRPLREPGSGGWITSLRISPHDSRRIVMGGDMLGAGVSLDGGRTWGPSFGFTSWEINDATFHPQDPNIVWYGTLSGPYKSVDGGQNYQEKRGAPSGSGFPPAANFGYSAPVERILFDPNNINHLITFGGSSRGWDLPGQKPLWGVVWESKDGGESWAKIATIGAEGNTDDPEKGVNIYSAEFAARSSQVLYAASPWAGFFVSKDGGKTWTKSIAGLPHTKVMRVQVHPANPQTLWVSLGAFKSQGADKALSGGIFKSTDGGASWTALNNGLNQANNADENLTANYQAFAVSPKNPDVMYCADGAWNGGVLYASRDGGQNWRAAANKKNDSLNNLVQRIAAVETALPAGLAGTVFSIDPNNPNIAFCVGSEHLIATTDGGQTWRDMGNDKQADGSWSGRGFAGWCASNVRFNPWKQDQIALNALDAARILISDNGGESWRRPLNDPTPWGGGQDTSFTPEGGIFVTTGQHGSFQGIARSKNGGKSWQILQGAKNGLPEAGWGKGNNEPAGVYAMPGTTKVWAGIGGKLYASSDGGDNWKTLEIGPNLRWIAADLKNAARFFVSGEKSVYFTKDGGQNWTAIGGPRKTGRMAVDSLGHLYICADEGERGGLWRWDEKAPDAQKWTRLWDDRWIMNVAVDPREPNRIAFTTNQNPYVEVSRATGVWLSDDGGKTFRAANDGLPMLRGHAIAFDPFEAGELIFGSFGRGFFEAMWPLTTKLRPGRGYVSTAADAEFAKAPAAENNSPATTPKSANTTPVPLSERRNILRNGDMAQGGVLPTNWTDKWGDVFPSRDTKDFKAGPASLRVDIANGSGQAFQLVSGYAGKTLLLSGFIKAAGNVKAQVAVQSFADDQNGGWQQKKFDQAIFVQGDVEWLEFAKLVQIPDGTLRFNVQLLAEGTGAAWLDEVKLVDPNDTAAAETVVITQPDAGPAPKDKPNVAGWGYYANFPLAWADFHKNFLARTKQGAAKNDISIVFLGDSITQGWNDVGKAVWDKYYAPLGAVNYGVGGDSTRQVLWRLQNGEVDGIKPKLVVLKIGTNNLYNDANAGSDEEIAAGIGAIVGLLRQKLPDTKILLLGVLPRENDYFSNRTAHINKLIAPLADDNMIRFLDMSSQFQTAIGKVKPELYNRDQLHLSAQGYEMWATTMKPLFDKLMKD